MLNSRAMPFHHLLLLIACVLLALPSCRDSQPPVRTPLPHRAYVWQREWTPAVSAAVRESQDKLAGHVLLGSEITWRKDLPLPLRASIDWSSVQTCALALRVAPHPLPFESSSINAIVEEAKKLIATAQQHGVTCTELQLDFDCAQKKLAGYRPLVQAVRSAIHPMPLVITTLPTWLAEPEFPALIAAADRYVLQVHSVQPARPGDQVAICDPERARQAVRQAEKLGREFEVALPTYSALVGLAPDGHVVGYSFEGTLPDWPLGTTRLSYRCEPDDMAALVREWTQQRPAHLRGIMWFRLPIKTDTRNWTSAQFFAAIEGRPLRHQITARAQGSNPVDLVLVNEGEATDPMPSVKVTWQGARLVASEGLPGWQVTMQDQSALLKVSDPVPIRSEPQFLPSQPGQRRRVLVPSVPTLPPGTQRSIGWLRFDQPATIHVEVVH